MRYEKLLAHMRKQKSFPLWAYATAYVKLAYDDKSKNLYLAHRQWASNYKDTFYKGIEESDFIIRPDNTAIFPLGDVSVNIMASFGISGRFTHRLGRMIRDVFSHELIDEYEALPGLTIDFLTGKPLNAKRIDEMHIDTKKKSEIDKKLNELKKVYCGLARLKGIEFDGDWSNIPALLNKRQLCDLALIDAMENKNCNKNIDGAMHWAAHKSREHRGNIPALFDIVVRNHKSAVYRHFGVIT